MPAEAAGQLISLEIVTGLPEDRLSGLGRKIEETGAQYCVVLPPDRRRVLGVVRFSDVAARAETSNRILSDLMRKPPAHIVRDTDPADVVQRLFEEDGPQLVTVISLSTGEYVGTITPESFTGWMLANERSRKNELERLLKEQKRFAAFIEQKLAARHGDVRRALSEFELRCVSFAHDIREPLGSIATLAESVATGSGTSLTPDGRDVIERMRRVASLAIEMASELLDRAGNVSFGSPGHSGTDLDAVLADACEFLGAAIVSSGATIVRRAPLGRVAGHYVPVLQVLINLIRNSVENNLSGRKPLVEVWTEDAAGDLLLRVKDNGPGLSRDHSEALFRPFVAQFGETADGTIFGLKIARNAVEALGGTVAVSTRSGEGTTFIVTLPAAPASA